MGAVGDLLLCGTGTICGVGTKVGQGDKPLFWLIYSKDTINDPTPTWNDASTYLRAFSTSRGRDSELDQIDAGTATFYLDNRTRVFDPNNDGLIRPRNRWKLWEQFNGFTNPVFSGYAESYDQTWPATGDAVAVVQCSDELAVLARDGLLTTDPPRDTYEDVVEFETPDGFWPFNDATAPGPALKANAQEGGKDLILDATVGGSSITSNSATPIQGDTGWELGFVNGAFAATDTLTVGDPTVVAGVNEFAVGFWFQFSAFALASKNIIYGPKDAAGNDSYKIILNNAGQLVGSARNSGAATVTVTSSALALNTWYHVVLTVESGSLRIYLNGTQSAATAFTPPFTNTLNATAQFVVGDSTATTQTFHYTQIWTDRTGISAPRVSAQYTAGAARGYPFQLANARMVAVLDTIGNQAPRNLRAATRNVVAVMQRGQDPLSELQYALAAENVDAMLFVAADGEITFLDSAHRSVSPWNTSQMTFSDTGIGGTKFYLTDDGLDVDYSESFLINEVNATRPNGSVQTQRDATSIAAYGKHSKSIDPPCINDADANTIATALLAKYKDPFLRVVKIKPKMADLDTLDVTMQRELGDKITVTRTPPGGGAAFTQSPWIQKIETSWTATVPILDVTLTVSPR